MPVRVIGAADVEKLVTPAHALEAMRTAFAALDSGRAAVPTALELAIPGSSGELHVKGGYIDGSPYFSVKTSTGFYRNPERGLPVVNGMTLVHDAETGQPVLLVVDGGLLTELRTGAAGALAADCLAKSDLEVATVVGAGGQARHQLTALLGVRKPRRVQAWARRREQAAAYAAWARQTHGIQVEVADDLAASVRASDFVVTTTPSTEPLIDAAWLQPGVHVTAMGSDMAEKRELSGGVLARADKVVCDSVASCLRSGELGSAVNDGTVAVDVVWAELGAVATGRVAGRTSLDEITVADLTGLGVQDAAIAGLVADVVLRDGLGREL